ncbi:hypothetical protein BKA62DRAFT_727166 [Auriculariales sp. MPI-PUGE-AT-0066]|nr:hypothetical protein BKA62DRAFT_727166 [Auriculariales sp. MPI-PUGE-AT-0066]
MSSDTLSVTYEDIDPVIEYTPYSQGDPAHGWETVFPSNEFVPSIGSSHQGIGNSMHRTTSAGTSLRFTFFGESLLLLGTANSSTYTVTLDDRPAQPGSEKGGILAEFHELPAGQHELRLDVVTPRPEFQFDRAIFEIELKGVSSKSIITAASTDDWHLSGGRWEPLTVSPSHDPTQNVILTRDLDSSARLDFQGTAIFVYGNLMSDHGPFQVDFDGEQWVGNGSTYGLVQSSLLYFRANLDDTRPHSITLTNANAPYFDIEKVVIVNLNGTTPVPGSRPDPRTTVAPSLLPTISRQQASSSAPSGSSTTTSPPASAPGPATAAIVGGAVAGCTIALLVVVIMIFLWLRRERRRECRSLPSKQDQLTAEPYFVPPPPRHVPPSWPSLPVSSHPPHSIGPSRTATTTESGFASIPQTVTALLSPEEYPHSVTAPHASPTQWVPKRRGEFQPWSLHDLNRVVHLSSPQLRTSDLEDSRTLDSFPVYKR